MLPSIIHQFPEQLELLEQGSKGMNALHACSSKQPCIVPICHSFTDGQTSFFAPRLDEERTKICETVICEAKLACCSGAAWASLWSVSLEPAVLSRGFCWRCGALARLPYTQSCIWQMQVVDWREVGGTGGSSSFILTDQVTALCSHLPTDQQAVYLV